MPIAALAVLAIILACAAYQYLKGKCVRAFATFITALSAGFVAFAYFELLAGLIVSRGDSLPAIVVPWAQTIAFVVLFLVVFAVLYVIAGQIMRRPVALPDFPDRIGRAVCGILLGLVLAGLLLTALAMAPLPNKYPYQRFQPANPKPGQPQKVLFSADGFATGWFSAVSRGAFSGKKSFAVLHPDFLDQAFLNRCKATAGIPVVTAKNAIELPQRRQDPNNVAAWSAPDGLNTTDGNPVPTKSGHSLVILRLGLRRGSIKDAGRFTPSQIRLICKQKGLNEKPLAGRAINAYPLGYMQAQDTLKLTRLTDKITVSYTDFDERSSVRYIDFAFYVPTGFVPVLIQFKQNGIAEVPQLASPENAPPTIPFAPKDEKRAPSKSTKGAGKSSKTKRR
ncbi:MAG: hypothetical protein ACYST6_13230 [Planctomycetota bacterium]|jgi:hypothetical protein